MKSEITTSTLERGLYERELASLYTELRKGLEIIDKALAKYCPGEHESARLSHTSSPEEFDQWMNSLRLGAISYYSGYYLHPVCPDVAQAPEVVRKAILDYAVKNFLGQVSEIEEVRSLAENAYYTAMNA